LKNADNSWVKSDAPATKKPPRVRKKSWEEFRSTGLLWWVNRILHVFGWAIVFNVIDKRGKEGKITEVYPARVRFRGFDESTEAEGFVKVSQYIKENSEEIHKESLE
jgi:hypothetical protein